MSNLVSYLFETNAIKVCPENKPFWYTSGKIGPYYINTHYLYGDEQSASNLLSFIDDQKSDKTSLPKKICDKVFSHYDKNEIYHNVINELTDFIKQNINISDIDYISGGERRDWFFSYIIAKLLDKPHITIYKDSTSIITSSNGQNILTPITSNSKVLHIADLITEASSYTRTWIPAIESLGCKICWSSVVVDRMQGGKEKLESYGIKSLSMVNVDSSLFKTALDMNIINNSQLDMLTNFYNNPDNTMREFLLSHPEFLENALSSDEKTASRANLCIKENLYNL